MRLKAFEANRPRGKGMHTLTNDQNTREQMNPCAPEWETVSRVHLSVLRV